MYFNISLSNVATLDWIFILCSKNPIICTPLLTPPFLFFTIFPKRINEYSQSDLCVFLDNSYNLSATFASKTIPELIAYGIKFLFMGDAEIEKENDLLKKYNLPNIDVLKVGHHRSKTSSS